MNHTKSFLPSVSSSSAACKEICKETTERRFSVSQSVGSRAAAGSLLIKSSTLVSKSCRTTFPSAAPQHWAALTPARFPGARHRSPPPSRGALKLASATAPVQSDALFPRPSRRWLVAGAEGAGRCAGFEPQRQEVLRTEKWPKKENVWFSCRDSWCSCF